jgi:hypothetical protein
MKVLQLAALCITCARTGDQFAARDIHREEKNALTLPPFPKPAMPDRKKPPAPSARRRSKVVIVFVWFRCASGYRPAPPPINANDMLDKRACDAITEVAERDGTRIAASSSRGISRSRPGKLAESTPFASAVRTSALRCA